jgi:hypothetical protein
MKNHELVRFKQCTFGDGGYWYRDGFDRAICVCGWESAPSINHQALVALFKIHKEEHTSII